MDRKAEVSNLYAYRSQAQAQLIFLWLTAFLEQDCHLLRFLEHF